jgi:hypothetical protein
MKSLVALAFSCLLFFAYSCGNKASDGRSNFESVATGNADLKVGGLYVSKNKNGEYGVTKILALEKKVVHVRMYTDKFDTKPTKLNSKNLSMMIGHAPMAREGFLNSNAELVAIEKVSEDELEGYNYFIKASSPK